MSRHLSSERIEELIVGFLTGALAESERQELEQWAACSPSNRRLLDSFSDAESLRRRVDKMRGFDTNRAWRRVEKRTRGHRLSRIVIPLTGAAAALLAGILLTFDAPEFPDASAVTLPQPLPDTIVQFRRASGEAVALDTPCHIELAGALVQGDAEGMTVMALDASASEQTALNTVSVPSGRRFEVRLDDGTRVCLNAGSTLQFPDRFPATGLREVFLSGEGYFIVSKDTARPFVVRTDGRYVRVTGTEFNVNCYGEISAQVTTLVRGSVSVGGPDAGEVALLPGMQATQDGGDIDTRTVDTSEYTAWMDGLFVFRDRSLEEIMESVAHWYGCRVVFENPSRKTLRFSGSISRSSSLEEVAAFFAHTKELAITYEDGMLIFR